MDKFVYYIFFILRFFFIFFFFFQAEDGIRDRNVTGVQTCALPICCFNHAGPALLNVGLRRAAQASYERMKQLDPHNPYYRLFELGTLISEKAWARAILLGRELLKDGVDHPVVRGRLAESCLHLRRYHEAWDALGPEPSGSADTA